LAGIAGLRFFLHFAHQAVQFSEAFLNGFHKLYPNGIRVICQYFPDSKFGIFFEWFGQSDSIQGAPPLIDDVRG
jgi:hypothetical protein